jgi:hypothetical protein
VRDLIIDALRQTPMHSTSTQMEDVSVRFSA